MPPMLQEPGSFGRHLPGVRIRQAAPLIHLLPQHVNDWRRIVLLVFRRKPLALVKNKLVLIGGSFALARLGNRRDEFGSAPRLDYFLCRLPMFVQFPMPLRTVVGRIENRLFKKGVRHFDFSFADSFSENRKPQIYLGNRKHNSQRRPLGDGRGRASGDGRGLGVLPRHISPNGGRGRLAGRMPASWRADRPPPGRGAGRGGRRAAAGVTAPQPGAAQDDVIFNEPGWRSRCRAGSRRGPDAEGSLWDTAWGRLCR